MSIDQTAQESFCFADPKRDSFLPEAYDDLPITEEVGTLTLLYPKRTVVCTLTPTPLSPHPTLFITTDPKQITDTLEGLTTLASASNQRRRKKRRTKAKAADMLQATLKDFPYNPAAVYGFTTAVSLTSANPDPLPYIDTLAHFLEHTALPATTPPTRTHPSTTTPQLHSPNLPKAKTMLTNYLAHTITLQARRRCLYDREGAYQLAKKVVNLNPSEKIKEEVKIYLVTRPI